MKLLHCAFLAIVSFSALLSCDNKDDASKKKPPGKVVGLTVASEKVSCPDFLGAHSDSADCLSVLEEGASDWESFGTQIEGFNYEPGFIYELKVEMQDMENPMADASSIRYVLKEVLSKTPVQ